MLIHTTQLIAVHNNTREQVEAYRKTILRKLQGSGSDELLARMSEQWNEELDRVPPEEMGYPRIKFEQIQPYLLDVIRHTEVVVDNSRSQYRLDYDGSAKIQIAIGGNTLSRGLTLEGLIVSFFVRAARTYDTLLQMGRWFGYRPGYADLPRIWMTAELQGHFFDLATIEEEIRQDVENYALMGVTPRQFGVRIRTHPDLNITAAAKMQHAVTAQVSYDENHVQTVLFEHRKLEWLEQNIAAADQLVADLASVQEPVLHNGHQIFYDVSVLTVISFLHQYQFHENNRALSSKLLIDYIRDQNKYDVLKTWNIVLRGVTARDKKDRGTLSLGGLPLPLLERARRKFPEEHAHIGVLMSKGDIGADLKRDPKQLRGQNDNQLKALRQEDMPNVGLLVIYPIAKDSEPGKQAKTKVALAAAADLIGLGLVFPAAVGESRGAQSYLTVDPSRLDRTDFELDEEDDEDA